MTNETQTGSETMDWNTQTDFAGKHNPVIIKITAPNEKAAMRAARKLAIATRPYAGTPVRVTANKVSN